MTGTSRRVFMSYARRDREKAQRLTQGLRTVGFDVWLDESLAGGQAWWDAILDQIGECEVFVQLVSPAALQSDACLSERKYAQALGKPVVPVRVEAIDMHVVPADLAALHILDCADITFEAAFALSRALQQCPPPAAAADAAPERPRAPRSYIASLSELADAPTLTQDEQLALVSRLGAAIDHDDQRVSAVEVLRRLNRRSDLYVYTAREIDRLLVHAVASPGASDDAAAATEPDLPAGGSSAASMPLPSDLSEKLRRANDALQAYEPRQALFEYLRVLSEQADSVEALAGAGWARFRLDRFVEAQADFDLVLQRCPDNVRALVGRSRVFSERYRLDDALADARKALELDRHSADARIAVGIALAYTRRYENVRRALEVFEDALSVEADCVEALAARAGALEALGNHKAALA